MSAALPLFLEWGGEGDLGAVQERRGSGASRVVAEGATGGGGGGKVVLSGAHGITSCVGTLE